MPNYKSYSYDQELMLPVSLSRQILPGTFEYTLNYLIDNKLDLSIFHQKYKNNEVGAPAFDPATIGSGQD
ncbi:MAG: hypothetical protein JW874_02095 [Spirochaetales bacterium]|nr:hypothetical protein [Spirochaetales bacterium]